MKLAKGPRPWPIWTFASILILYGLFNLIAGLAFIPNQVLLLRSQMPSIDWNRDLAIVWISAQFTIVLIPIVAVWGFASRTARLMVTIMALFSLPWIGSYIYTFQLYGVADWVGLSQAAVVVIAAGLLYLPASSQWLRQEVADDTVVFE